MKAMTDTVPEKTMTDEDLMMQVRRGDEDAFRRIVERHQTSVYQLCYQFTGNRADAEDTAQEVFIRLYRSRERYRPSARLSTYLYRIAVNLSLNAVRNRKRRRWMPFLDNKEASMQTPFQDTQNPEVSFEQQELADAVRDAIGRLPEQQRTAVILKRYHGMSYQEISTVMACSVSSVEARLHRARLKLKRWLAPYVE